MADSDDEKTNPRISYWAGTVDSSLQELRVAIDRLSSRMDKFMDNHSGRERETSKWRSRIERLVGVSNGNGDKDRYVTWPWILENIVVPTIRYAIGIIVAYIAIKAFGLVV